MYFTTHDDKIQNSSAIVISLVNSYIFLTMFIMDGLNGGRASCGSVALGVIEWPSAPATALVVLPLDE